MGRGLVFSGGFVFLDEKLVFPVLLPPPRVNVAAAILGTSLSFPFTRF